MHEKTLSSEACDELCNIMDSLQLNTNESVVNIGEESYGLRGSFIGEGTFQQDEMEQMVNNWAFIESNPLIIDAYVDKVIEELEQT